MTRDPAHCTFCDLIQGAAEVSICHEDADSIAFMDIQPVNNGHVLVVPREHRESLAEVPEDLAIHLFKVTMRLANAVRRVSGCDDLNIVVNSGAAAGQDEPHYHVHIIPRRVGDGFDIPLPFNGSAMPDRTVLDIYAAQIISALRDPMAIGTGARNGRSLEESEERARPQESRKPEALKSGQSDRNERVIDVATFAESPVERTEPDEKAADAPPQPDAPRRTGHWRIREGPHGELRNEPYTDTGDPA